MPCKKEIKQKLQAFIQREGSKYKGKNIKTAEAHAARMNELFNEEVISYEMDGDNLIMNVFEPSPELIDIYYYNELSQEAEAGRKKNIFREYSPAAVDNKVKYNLKAIDILQSNKAKQVFAKGKKNGWDLNKILTELQVPKQQKEIILNSDFGGFYVDELSLRENIIMTLLADNSFVVEINTAKGTKVEKPIGSTYNDEDGWQPDFEEIIIDVDTPTQYYSSLTVPGGINYTENEIATPAITPNIKGHAQFSTDNGIGWFRSDDRAKPVKNVKEKALQRAIQDDSFLPFDKSYLGTEPTDSKTRRILEVQSDLFQKSRDKDVLVSLSKINVPNNFEFISAGGHIIKKEKNKWFKIANLIGRIEKIQINEKEVEQLYDEKFKKSPIRLDEKSNSFLQLLNKKGNWINFFIQSIVQDSARKGYEKVLFPKGDTASKIQGHETLEEFKKQKEDRIKNVEKQKELALKNPDFLLFEELGYEDGVMLKGPSITIEDLDNEIKQLREEIKKVEEEGFGALKPIDNFYENRVTNILNKLYDVKEITDEYDNKWSEIEITPEVREKEIEFSPAAIDYSQSHVPPAVNFGTYVSRQEALIELVDGKVKNLQRLTKTPEIRKNIERLKKLRSSLKFEKKELVRKGYSEQNLMDRISNSFELIDEYLLGDPSISDLVISKNYLDFLNTIMTGSDVVAVDSPLKNSKNFQQARARLGQLTETYTIKSRDKALAMVDMTEEELAEIDKSSDINMFAKQVYAIDMIEGTHPITDKVKETFDRISSNSETTDMNERLFQHKKDLDKELKKNGHKYNHFFDGGLRLKSKLDHSWEQYKRNVGNQLREINDKTFDLYRKGGTKLEWENINRRLRGIQNRNNFINPALLLGSKFTGDYKFLNNIPEADSKAYREELLTILSGNTGSRDIAEDLLLDFENEMYDRISEYEAGLEAERMRLSLKEGTEDMNAWSDKSKNTFERKKQTESPFTLGFEQWRKGKSDVGVELKGSDGNIYTVQHSLKNQILFPKARHISKDFEQTIEANPTYKKAWKMMKEHQEYIHENSTVGKTSPYDLIADSDFIDGAGYKLHPVIVKAAQNFKQWIKQSLSIKRNQTTRKDKSLEGLKVYGNQKTIIDAVNKEINTHYKPYVTAIYGQAAWGSVPGSRDIAENLERKLKVPENSINGREPLDIQVKELLQRKYVDHQNTDYIESLLKQSQLAQKLKNQKEAENEVLFLFNVLQQEVPSRTEEIDLNVQYIKQAVFQEKYLGDKGFIPTGKKISTYFSNASLQEIRAIKDSIKELEGKDLTPEGYDLLRELKESLENKGRPITPKSALYSMIFQFSLMKDLGWNIKTQVFNKIAGDTVSRAVDGWKWTRGNFPKAVAMTTWWRKNPFSQEGQHIRNIDQILDMLGVYQDAKNEIYKIQEKRRQNMFVKNITQPLNVVTATEKRIQRPQILSLLGDMTISAPGQPTVPVIDLNNKNNPYPAFIRDEALGVMRLRPEYSDPKTPEGRRNKATWEQRNSAEYAQYFGESGVIPYTIAELNSDYRDNSYLLAKQSGFGVAAFFFKRFILSYMILRYGKDGAYRKLYEDGHSEQLISGLASNMIYSTIPGMSVAGSFGSIPGMFMGGAGALAMITIASTTIGRKQRKKYHSDMKKHLSQLNNAQKVMTMLKYVGSNLVNLGKFNAAVALKMAQAKGEYFTGKQIVSDKFILDFTGIAKENMSEEVQARMNYVLYNAQRTLSIYLIKAAILSMFAPDEDDEKEYKELSRVSKVKAILEKPEVAGYYTAVNTFNRILDDHLVVDAPSSMIENLKKWPIPEKIVDGFKLGISFSEYMVTGESPVIGQGPNMGREKIDVQLEKVLRPAATKAFGFGSLPNVPGRKSKAETLATKITYDLIDRQREDKYEAFKKERLDFWISKGTPLGLAKERTAAEVTKKYDKSTLKEDYFKKDGTLTKYGEKRLKALGYNIP